MADGIVKVQDTTTGNKILDNTELTVGANVVERERIVIAGANATDLADVDSVRGLASHDEQVMQLLTLTLVEARVHSIILQSALVYDGTMDLTKLREAILENMSGSGG